MRQIKSARYSFIPGLYLMASLLMAGSVIWDEAKEWSVAEKLSHDIEIGQVILLNVANGREFPAVFTRAVPEHGDTVLILIHGMGGHPDWPEVISPLRLLLADNGWSTLSIQMPVLPPEIPLADYGKTLDESQKRIASAIQYLENYGYERVVLVGYGFGAAVAADFLASSNANEVYAFAGISMLARKYLEPAMNIYDYLEKLTMPVLDVYGSEDLKTITSTADQRRLAARRNGSSNGFQQIVIWDADHYFSGHDQALYIRLNDWLAELMQDKNKQLPD